jgi:RNA polymerase sigma-70 factor (ECF subfamily)
MSLGASTLPALRVYAGGLVVSAPVDPSEPAEQKIDPRVTAAAGGDRRAAQALLSELLPRARNLIRYLVRGDGDVDDIAQESLIALARGFAGFRGEGKLSSWADRIVVRTTFAYLRRLRRDQAMQSDAGQGQPELLAVPHPDAQPDEYAERRELVKLLDGVPDQQRHALVLHFVVGASVPEIAVELAIPEETVRSRLRLGKARLRGLYDVATTIVAGAGGRGA